MSKVVGVRVTHSILKVILGSNIGIHLDWGIGWSRGISWGRCRCISRGRCWSIRSWCGSWSVRSIVWPGNCYSNDDREGKDLLEKISNFREYSKKCINYLKSNELG